MATPNGDKERQVQANIAVIGGSGLYEFEATPVTTEIDIPTPFGMPSDVISVVDLDGVPVAFLPRHGKGHRLTPTEVPSKANIWALKSLGVQQIISVSAVGSLVEEMQPGTFVVCTQLIDRTRSRSNSYFGNGIVGHAGFSDPFCAGVRDAAARAIEEHALPACAKGTLVTMEGPLFSSKAESHLYRSWGADLIGMTALPEAKLAREAEICYATIAMVTDYDCWRESEQSVDIDMVLRVMKENIRGMRAIIPDIVADIAKRKDCACRHAAEHAILTNEAMIPYEVKRKLSLFYSKYWK